MFDEEYKEYKESKRYKLYLAIKENNLTEADIIKEENNGIYK